jgi:hypothetical protein
MWLSNAVLRSAAATLTLLGGSLLAGCSFAPVYSGALAASPSLNLAYGKPNSRLEQIVYQELSLRLGETQNQAAPLLTVSVASNASDMARSQRLDPREPEQVTVTATATITRRDGSKTAPVTLTRFAVANYTRSGQVLADNAALNEAAERAAKSVAESLRLAILADLSRG